jgi:murein DD-endopeptidase MepM/ murein hydrolase activator NlpD
MLGRATFGLSLALALLAAAPLCAAIKTMAQPALREHVLAEGETLFDVALKHGLSVKALKDANAFEDAENLHEGTIVRLPAVAPYNLGALGAEQTSFALPDPAPVPSPSELPPQTPAIDDPQDDEDAEELVLPARQQRPKRAASPSGFQWPVDGHVMSKFGKRRRRLHAGVDLKAPRGAPVRAARDGYVIFSGRVRGHGRVLVLEHEDGFHTVYAHNSKHHVSVETDGERLIKAGDLIADVGASGNASTPHVHFEIRVNGIPVNPMDHLVAAP